MRSTTLPTHLTLLDPATGAPLRAIGVRRNGQPIWPILGGADGDGAGGDGSGSGAGGDGSGDGKSTGGSGTAFTPITSQEDLDRLIAGRINRERAKFQDYDSLKSAKAELDALKADAASDLDKAVAKARTEALTEASGKANSRLVAAEVRAQAAAAGFHEPKDAPRLLDLTGVKVTEDGDVDAAAVKALIDQAVTERPYLVKAKETEMKTQRKRDPGQGSQTGTGNGGLDAGLDRYAERKAKRTGGTATT